MNLHRLFDELSNWGAWGDDDQAGTLNHLSTASAVRGLTEVEVGKTISMSRRIPTGNGQVARLDYGHKFRMGDGQSAREIQELPGFRELATAYSIPAATAVEELTITSHGSAVTHLDSPGHIAWNGLIYNGRAAETAIQRNRLSWVAITEAGAGITTRGILVDAPALLGVERLPDGATVGPDVIETMESETGVTVTPGDALFLFTGYDRSDRERIDPRDRPGWDADALRLFRERGVSVIGADTPQDAFPAAEGEPNLPVHIVGLVSMGLWMIDNCELVPLAEALRDQTKITFLLNVGALPIEGASSSPVNPLAVI